MPAAISAQGTLIARQPLGVGPFTTIGELRNITSPSLSRKTIETSSHNEIEESYVVGIRRKSELTFTIGFVPQSEPTHGIISGLQQAWRDGSRDVYRITYPEGTQWLFSGFVSQIAVKAPLDDGLTADISIRPTNLMTII